MSSENINEQIGDHTFKFAQAVREFGKILPVTVSNIEDLKQLIRASGAVGSSYITATGATKREDYLMSIKSCSTETRTTEYWLKLVDTQGDPGLEQRRKQLLRASQELNSIFIQILHPRR